jgi:hypothetical protein
VLPLGLVPDVGEKTRIEFALRLVADAQGFENIHARNGAQRSPALV